MTIEEAIERLEGRYMNVSMCGTSENAMVENEAINMAITALRAQQEDKKFNPPCYQPEQFGDGCAYQCYDGDDEPIDKCKECPLCNSDKHRCQQEAEKNEPLTLKEMRKMDGEPVYVVPQNGGYVAGATNWAKVNAKCERCEASNLNFYFCEYVTYWLAYRHPPKEVHDV